MVMTKKYYCIPLIFILILSLLGGCVFLEEDTDLSIHIIDVGQGDSILVKTPNGKTMLIDGGEPSAGKTVVSYLDRNNINKIDVLIATHPHADHIGGLIDVLKNFEIGKFYMPRKIHTSKTYEKLLETAKSEGIKITAAKKDIVIDLDQDITLYFLNPLRDYGDDLNMWSAVVKMEYGEKSFLFTGDFEVLGEKELCATYDKDFLKSQFLKVAHHGSNTSTSQEFLDVIEPKVAIISSEKGNSYGHPHEEVVERLKNFGTTIYRTDEQGTIVIRSDGDKIWSNQEPYYSK